MISKILLLLLLFVYMQTCKSYSQQRSTPVYHLTKTNVKLIEGWVFHAGDDPKWAETDFDDRTWDTINPTLSIIQLPRVREAGIGWFRLKLKVDSSLLNEQLAMVYTSNGASEVYLNGKLVYKFGTVSKDAANEITKHISYRPMSIKLGGQEYQQLAVRYSMNKRFLQMFMTHSTCVQFILKDYNQAFNDYLRYEGFYKDLQLIQLIFYVPLTFILLFFFLNYKKRKEYLYIGIFFFSISGGTLLHLTALMETRTLPEANVMLFIQNISGAAGLLFFLTGIYTVVKQKRKWQYYFIVSFIPVYALSFFIVQNWTSVIGPVYVILINIDFLRICIKANRRSQPGSITLTLTGIVSLMLMLATLYFESTGKGEPAFFSFSLAFMVLPIGLSLYFAGEFARTGRSLQSRLVEVEQLSEKTILQEKEKQQILAQQNILLEEQIRERTTELLHQREALEFEKEAKLLADFNRKFSESELKALRSQMNPHFVFNILNTIESYALENNKEAVSLMIQKFSRLTRLVLENSLSQLVPFENDWKSLQLYIELEQMRYARVFSVNYYVQPVIFQREYFIPPMIIQPFVENAIIHGVRNKQDNTGILNLSANLHDGYIIVQVEDNGVGRKRTAELKINNPIQKNSLGIKVTQDRISIFNNLMQDKKAKVEIEDLSEGTRVVIYLPIEPDLM
ncbi:MAG TPA: histidine kinase [Chitinophagaceae bacterium]